MKLKLGLSLNKRDGFEPSNVFVGGAAGVWYDPSDLSTMRQDSAGTIAAAVNSPVGYIADKSGRGNHAVQTTDAQRPILRQSGSLYYLEFDGTDDNLLKAFTISQPWDRISAIRQLSWTLNDRIYAGASNAFGLLRQSPTTPSLQIYSGTDGPSSSAAALSSDVVVTERFNSASSRLAINNGAYATGDVGLTEPTGIRIGHNVVAAQFYFYGVIMRAGTMADWEINALRQYMARKAGITL